MQLGIIGGGMMGEALLSRLLDRQLFAPTAVCVSEPRAERRSQLTATYGIQTTDNNAQVATAPVLLLAVKPQIFPQVAAELAAAPRSATTLVLSILAGTTLAQLEAAFPGQPVIRAMPNTPATVGAGVTAIAPGQHVQDTHLAQARDIFGAVGTVVDVPESLMDAVTGLSGSGPGFVAVMIEALIDGGVAAGLPRVTATQLALQTVQGTAQLLQTTGEHPAQLKDRVTSPGGTTITGITQMEQHGVRAALIQAVLAAYGRSQALGQ